MNSKQHFALTAAIVVVCSMFLFIVFGDSGLVDLKVMKTGRDSMIKRNETLYEKNLAMCRTIRRLKTDPVFIDAVARKELGLIGRNEIVFKLVKTERAGIEQ